jgi:hypothetical protein
MFVLFLALALVQPCLSQKPEWKGTVTIENNVHVIRNPRAPLYGTLKLDLKEELSIGHEDDKNYLFWRITDVCVDPDGNIYVVDMRNCRVQKFDPRGRFLATIGCRGQGPGEFQMPKFVRIDPRTEIIFVFDVPNIILPFDKIGHPLTKLTLGKVVYDFQLLEDGGFLAISGDADDKRASYALVKIDVNGKIIRTFAGYPSPVYMQKINGGTMMIVTGYEFDMRLAKIDRNTYVFGYSKDYEFTIINAEGTVLGRMAKETPQPSFSASEKAEFKKLPVPERYPYFFGILTDSKGRIYIQRNNAHRGKSTVQDTVPKDVDVFSREGYFLYTTALPPNTTIIRDGYIYAFLADENEGLESVKRYKILNWDRIKDR